MEYNPVLPQMSGLSGTATDAAVNNTTTNNPGMGQLSPQTQGLIDQNINPITGSNLNPSFFQKGGMAEIGLGAINTLGSLWNSFKQQKIAQQSLTLQKETFDTNLRNQTQSYNTALEDRVRTRFDSERKSSSEAKSYIEKHKL